MGMQRYSEPRCEPFGTEGSPCRPYQRPENKTLHYPFGTMQCDDVYMQFCPCGKGLRCDDGVCVGQVAKESTGLDDERPFELLTEYRRFH